LTKLQQLLPMLSGNIPEQYLPPSSPQLAALKKRYTMVHPNSIYSESTAPPQPMVPETHQYTRLTYLPILLKTLSKAMTEWPLFRSTITPSSSPSPGQKPTLTIRPQADISIALSTSSGLFAPTLTGVDKDSIYTIAGKVAHLSSLARQTGSGKPGLGPKELPKRGGSISVSNVGAVGKGMWAHPILVPGSGGVAIVALGRAQWVWDVDEEGMWVEKQGEISKMGERRLKMGVSWSADHRVVEGAELAAFVECWRAYVEQPERLIAEGI